jgi:hypothetical protein
MFRLLLLALIALLLRAHLVAKQVDLLTVGCGALTQLNRLQLHFQHQHHGGVRRPQQPAYNIFLGTGQGHALLRHDLPQSHLNRLKILLAHSVAGLCQPKLGITEGSLLSEPLALDLQHVNLRLLQLLAQV